MKNVNPFIFLFCCFFGKGFLQDVSSPLTLYHIYQYIDSEDNALEYLGEININKRANNPSPYISSDVLSIKNDIVVGGFKAGENVNLIANFVPHAGSLTNKFWKNLEESCNNDGLYHLVIPILENYKKTDFENINLRDGTAVHTITKSCLLLDSNFTLSIWLTFNLMGQLISANIKTPYLSHNFMKEKNQRTNLTSQIPLSKSSSQPSDESSTAQATTSYPDTAYNVRAFVQQMVQAPVPDTQTWLQRLELEKAEKTKSAYGEKNSFFAKYWIYIVIFFVFVLLSGAMNPDSGGGR